MNLIFFNKLLSFSLMFIPIFLITGPAIPDIVISLSAIYFLIFFVFIKKEFIFLKDKFFQISILFWLSLIFVSFFAFDKIKSFQDSIIFIRFLIAPTIAFFLLINNEKKIETTIKIIFVSVCFVTLDSLFQYINYESETGFGKDILGFKSNWYGRLTGPFGDEHVPGAYISKFGLLGYLFFYYLKKRKLKSLYEVLYLSILGFTCFASGERMALATYFMGLFFLIIFLSKKRLILLVTIFISIFLIFTSLKIHPFYNDFNIISSTHYHQGMTIEKNYECKENLTGKCKKIINIQPSFIEVLKNFTTSAYGEIYNVGINMIIDNPITGIGISNYQTGCIKIKKYNELMVNYDCASHPHNNYIQWLAEGGLVAFSMFIFFIGAILYYIFKGKNNNEVKFITAASILILFWPLMSTGSLIKNWNGSISFFIITVCLCLNRIKLTNLKT